MGRLTVYTGCRYDTYDPIDTKYDFSEINLQKLIDKLARYEDLEETGRLVVLPCKVGEIVYKLFEFSCCRFIIKKKHFYYNDIPDFGETVFLTHEEAEAALKGKGGDSDV